MQLRKCVVNVNAQRRLLALIATLPPHAATTSADEAAAIDISGERFDDVLVYLHGFPDMAVHPTALDFASRMPVKLAEAWLSSSTSESNSSNASGGQRSVAFLAFNFGGVPGSDQELRFTDKTISKEVEDAVAVCQFVRQNLLRVRVNVNGSVGRVHVVGLSTGAIVASLLRSREGIADTITVIAGLLDLKRGVEYDFSPQQMTQFENEGACWKEFYLPEEVPLPGNVDISFDGETKADIQRCGEAGDTSAERLVPRKVFIRLNKKYVDECRDSTLDIKRAVSAASQSPDSHARSLPPFLVIHGDADQSVPFHNGEELFSAASKPKAFLPIPKANHLLSNSKQLKKALKAIVEHTRTASTLE